MGGSFVFNKFPKKSKKGGIDMGRPPKLTLVNKKHLTKNEIRKRKEKEDKLLKSNKIDKIKPPSWLSAKAKTLFNDLSEDLIELNVLNNLDINSLALYCHHYIKFLELEKEIKKEGETIEYTNREGFTNVVENPKLKIKNKYFEILNKLSKEFGLSPLSRLRLTVHSNEKESEIHNFNGAFKL